MQQNFESDFCPSKGRLFIALPRYLAQNHQCTCLGRKMSSFVVLIKKGLLKLHKSCSILVLTLVFSLQEVFDGECPRSLHCGKGMEMSLPTRGSEGVLWERDPKKLLSSSLQCFSWRHFGCRGISMWYLFYRNWRKSVCSFYWSVILKHSCISGARQLTGESMAHSPH